MEIILGIIGVLIAVALVVKFGFYVALIVGFIGLITYLVQKNKQTEPKPLFKQWWLYCFVIAIVFQALGLGIDIQPDGKEVATDHTTISTSIKETKVSTSKSTENSKEKKEQQAKEAEEKKKAEEAAKKKKKETERKKALAAKKSKEEKNARVASAKKATSGLASLDYQGTQTINVNDGVPTFSEADLSLKNGAWEQYGNLDNLNRATSAEAMLNQSTMPKDGEERESISNVKPTGWRNKKINSGYLFNRSHLIGWALSAENANWKNLITGTRQLNSPEMVRFEMDTKYYLEQSKDNYVRYSVTPIFRENELLARGVHMMAQSVKDDSIAFNVYIFNIQDGVDLDYSDGSSQVQETQQAAVPKPKKQQSSQNNDNQATGNNQETEQAAQNDNQGTTVYITPTGSKYHAYAHGNGSYSPTTLDHAKSLGLEPCKVCSPPQ